MKRHQQTFLIFLLNNINININIDSDIDIFTIVDKRLAIYNWNEEREKIYYSKHKIEYERKHTKEENCMRTKITKTRNEKWLVYTLVALFLSLANLQYIYYSNSVAHNSKCVYEYTSNVIHMMRQTTTTENDWNVFGILKCNCRWLWQWQWSIHPKPIPLWIEPSQSVY